MSDIQPNNQELPAPGEETEQQKRERRIAQMAAERHMTVEQLMADFYRMVMQAEAAWEEAEGEGYDWREDTWDELAVILSD